GQASLLELPGRLPGRVFCLGGPLGAPGPSLAPCVPELPGRLPGRVACSRGPPGAP
ncbi:hypothetical protein Dimus_020588, partial [Dionaea muscipula]